jgi:hypothetical protein
VRDLHFQPLNLLPEPLRSPPPLHGLTLPQPLHATPNLRLLARLQLLKLHFLFLELNQKPLVLLAGPVEGPLERASALTERLLLLLLEVLPHPLRLLEEPLLIADHLLDVPVELPHRDFDHFLEGGLHQGGFGAELGHLLNELLLEALNFAEAAGQVLVGLQLELLLELAALRGRELRHHVFVVLDDFLENTLFFGVEHLFEPGEELGAVVRVVGRAELFEIVRRQLRNEN